VQLVLNFQLAPRNRNWFWRVGCRQVFPAEHRAAIAEHIPPPRGLRLLPTHERIKRVALTDDRFTAANDFRELLGGKLPKEHFDQKRLTIGDVFAPDLIEPAQRTLGLLPGR